MIYAGIKQKSVEMRIRHAIQQIKVGKTGYVYVLGGRGEDRGRYIISWKGRGTTRISGTAGTATVAT
jgi:hypothetical protein